MSSLVADYRAGVRRKVFAIVALTGAAAFAFALSLGVGPTHIPVPKVLQSLLTWSKGNPIEAHIVRNVRLPRAIAGLVVGASLSVSGCTMQCILRNPLASPYTMGISQGSVFGASLAIVFLGAGGAESGGRIFVTNPYAVALCAFLASFVGALTILLLARFRDFSSEALVLAGIAVGSLFAAGTMLIQYFANELQLSAMVYWSFGDLSRPLWTEIAIMGIVCSAVLLYLTAIRWDLNALSSGEEVAKSLGVATWRVRVFGMLAASLLTSVCVSFVGIVGFVGLVAPHICRLFIGDDYRFLIPASAVMGSLVTLIADLVARVVLSPLVLPVGVLTSFIGAPLFLYLLVRPRRGLQ